MKVKLLVFTIIVSSVSLGVGCGSGSIDSVPPAGEPCNNCVDSPPAVTSVYPPIFYSGAEVKVSGSYLDQATVVVNGAAVKPFSQSAHELYFFAPNLPAGSYQLDIENAVGYALSDVTYQNVLSASVVSSGSLHTCALTAVGRVQCWGRNFSGQLGDGSTTGTSTSVTVSGLTDVVSISAGRYHTCAVINDGHVQCWGSNAEGQLGDGSTIDTSTAVTVSGLSDAVSVSAGGESGGHTCVVTSGGRVQCWGNNDSGQLGDGSGTDALNPVTVTSLSGAVSVSAGGSHSCALYQDEVVQ